jgi:hypothetical protein
MQAAEGSGDLSEMLLDVVTLDGYYTQVPAHMPLCKSPAIASASLLTPQKATAAELVRPLAAVEAWRQCRSQRSRSA